MTPTLMSVIIVNYNSGDCLGQCLHALSQQSYSDFEVILVDNASSDDSLKAAYTAYDYPVQIIKNTTNKGFAAANNQAAMQATGKWLVFLNPDAFASPDWLHQLYQATHHYPDFTLFGSTQINADDPSYLDGCGDIYHILGIPSRGLYGHSVTNIPSTGEVFAPCAAASMIRRDRFQSVGGFDECFFCYCEDIDLAFRLRLLGDRCLQLKEAVIYHKSSYSTNQISGFALYHGMRNRLWVFVKNMPFALLLPLLPLHLLIQLLMLLRAARKGQLATAWKGFKDGLLGLSRIRKQRQSIQSKRKIPLSTLLRSFTYSPITIIKRRADIK